VYCGGVLQHIPDIGVITNYFKEGLRVLKPNGILNFSIQVWMLFRKGGIMSDRTGAQVKSSDIEFILNEMGHELVRIYYDEKDPIPHYNILIRKLDEAAASENISSRKLKPYVIEESIVEKMDVRTGIFEDLASYENMRQHWAVKIRRGITFFKQPKFHPVVKRVLLFGKKVLGRK
jgi:SAM-dependent methyltransferase